MDDQFHHTGKRRRVDPKDEDDPFDNDPLSPGDAALNELLTQADAAAAGTILTFPNGYSTHMGPRNMPRPESQFPLTAAGSIAVGPSVALPPQQSEIMALRNELARLQIEVQSKVGEAQLLRQNLATAEFAQRKLQEQASDYQAKLKQQHQAELMAMREKMSKSEAHALFDDFDVRKSQWQANRVSYSQATQLRSPRPAAGGNLHRDVIPEMDHSPVLAAADTPAKVEPKETSLNDEQTGPLPADHTAAPFCIKQTPSDQVEFPPYIIAKLNTALDMLTQLSAPAPLFQNILTTMSGSTSLLENNTSSVSMMSALSDVFVYLTDKLPKIYPSTLSSTNIDPYLILINYPQQINFYLMTLGSQLSAILFWYTRHSSVSTQDTETVKSATFAVLQLICAISFTVIRNRVQGITLNKNSGYTHVTKLDSLETGWVSQISVLFSSIIHLQQISRQIRSVVARVSIDFIQKDEIHFLIKSSCLESCKSHKTLACVSQWIRLVIVSHEPFIDQIIIDQSKPRKSTIHRLSQLLIQQDLKLIRGDIVALLHALTSHHPELMYDYWNTIDSKGLSQVVSLIHEAAYEIKTQSCTTPAQSRVNYQVLRSGLHLLCMLCFHCQNQQRNSPADVHNNPASNEQSVDSTILCSMSLTRLFTYYDVPDEDWSVTALWAQVKVFAIVELVKDIIKTANGGFVEYSGNAGDLRSDVRNRIVSRRFQFNDINVVNKLVVPMSVLSVVETAFRGMFEVD